MWTIASGISDHVGYTSLNCPCATYPGPSAPAFVGNDYYCESGNSAAIPTTYVTLFGMGVGVTYVVNVVLKWGGHGFIRSYLYQQVVILKFVSVRTKPMLMKILLSNNLNFMFAVRHKMHCIHFVCLLH